MDSAARLEYGVRSYWKRFNLTRIDDSRPTVDNGKLRGDNLSWLSGRAGIHVAGGWRTCFPACHNRLIVLQTPSVAPPELNRRATHAGTAPGRRQFRFAGAPRLQARRAAPLVSNTVSVRTGNALTSPESVVLGTKRIYCWKTIGNHDFEWCSDWAQQCPRAPWVSMPPLVREVRLSESMDLLTGFSRLLRWRYLSKDPSILTNKLRGPAPAWPSMDRRTVP